MYPYWWNDTITLYRRKENKNDSGKTIITWERERLQGCFWSTTHRQALSNTELTYQSTFIIRIPAAQCEPINKGDIAIKGDVEDKIVSVSEILNKYSESFVINTTKDNSRLPESHYYGSDA